MWVLSCFHWSRGSGVSLLPPDLPPSFAHAIIRHFPLLGLRLRTAEPAKAEPASAALIAVANSFGVRYPKLLCGPSFVVLDPPHRDLPPVAGRVFERKLVGEMKEWIGQYLIACKKHVLLMLVLGAFASPAFGHPAMRQPGSHTTQPFKRWRRRRYASRNLYARRCSSGWQLQPQRKVYAEC
jgi:hypothetical protein